MEASTRFNPLHCGAVVASHGGGADAEQLKKVSIPFIAGQWSLRGAVEAPPARAGAGFNPLHCGAVVASTSDEEVAAQLRKVSIPFIAGQWSLQGGETPSQGMR